jgi:hypothetical protein
MFEKNLLICYMRTLLNGDQSLLPRFDRMQTDFVDG